MISNADLALHTALDAHRAGRSVIFDLDNTLYSELSFLDQVYEAFARSITVGSQIDEQKLASFMKKRLRAGMRSTLLQDICERFCLPLEVCRLQLFDQLREKSLPHPLALFTWAEAFLREVPDFRNCAIITNGNVLQQQNKLAHLPQLSRVPRTKIIFANLYAAKPAIDAARHVEDIMDCINPLYIGDSVSDSTFAENAGWGFFRVNFQIL